MFQYPIPVRVFLKNGGSLAQRPIIQSNNVDAQQHSFVKREDTLLWIGDNEGRAVHIDTCWVLCNVNV